LRATSRLRRSVVVPTARELGFQLADPRFGGVTGFVGG
jgi:hypothetical protein